ncbi:hypothetical protein ACFL3S_07995 [Gemmatimonadota bacterium]
MAELSPYFSTPLPESRPEAMADVPGVCELSLTRAVVQYRHVHEVDLPEGRIEDIGLALVLEGRFAASAQVVDLGSARVKQLDLSTELVVLDWVYEPTLEHVHRTLRAASDPGSEGRPARKELAPYCFDLALRVLRRAGYGPLSRPTLLRIGFRDICRDLDLHEGTSVRIVLGKGRIVRAHLDCDGNALVFQTAFQGPDESLEGALREAFAGQDIRRLVPAGEGSDLSYQVRFPLPLDLLEVRMMVREIRKGLAHLLGRFEPERYRALLEVLGTFGTRDTLSRIHFRDPKRVVQPLGAPVSSAAARVH